LTARPALTAQPALPAAPAKPASSEADDRAELGRRPPPQRNAGRAVLVYEPEVRRPWRLWVFTAVLVSLTVGVVLGQAEAYQPADNRSTSTQAGLPPAVLPSDVVQGPSAAPPGAVTPPQLSAPLGAVTSRQLEVVGDSSVLRIRTAELGAVMFNITAIDQSVAPQLTDTKAGSRLDLTRTGAAGTVGAEVVLNSKVAWTVKLSGASTELNVDSMAGGLAGIDVAAAAARSVLQLPKPKGTVPLTLSGTVGELTVRTEAGAPVRVRLAKGARLATVAGKAQQDVKAGATLTEDGWRNAATRYDVKTAAEVSTLVVERVPTGQ
jgi:hypothetical protein